MKRLAYMIYILVLLTIAVYLIIIFNNITVLKAQINELNKTVCNQQEEQLKQNITLNKGIYALAVQIEELQEDMKHIKNSADAPETEPISRGASKTVPLIMRVTAYDLSYESCEKYPNHPEYGITASGNKVKEWHTIAAGPEIPFNTKIFIPYFQDQPNKGIFVVQDRGSAIKENCLDVYMESGAACRDFGVKNLDVYVLN